MVPPLQNTPGTLLPDNAPTLSTTNLSSPRSETFNLSPTIRSYASVTATSSRDLRLDSRSSKSNSPHPKKELSLFRSTEIENYSNDSSKRLIHLTGTTDYSVFYHIPKRYSSLRSALGFELSQKFPLGIGLGLTVSEDSTGTYLEFTLASKEYCDSAIESPISIGDTVFHASPAVHPDRALLRVNLTKLPIWNLDKLRNSLLNNLSRYGIVREIIIYLDDWSGSWPTGNGHVYLERPITATKTHEVLTYNIPLEGENTFCLGTWTNMGKHCVYCKGSDHYRKDCTKAPSEKRRCYQCGNSGHIARNCFRRMCSYS
jgi:hypothetical protein